MEMSVPAATAARIRAIAAESRALQQATVAAHQLGPVVTIQLLKRIVGKDDPIVANFGVGDDHGHPVGSDGGPEGVAPALLVMHRIRQGPVVPLVHVRPCLCLSVPPMAMQAGPPAMVPRRRPCAEQT